MKMTHQTTTLRSLMMRLTLAASLVLGALVGTAMAPTPAAAQGVDLEASSVRFGQLAQELETLRNRRRALQSKYGKLTDDIAARKRARRGQNLLSDIELQNLLKRGRATADDLYELQARIRGVEGELASARRQVLSAFDERLTKLETNLVSGQGSNRAAVIAEMNRLRQARFAYVAPTTATPDLDLADLPNLDAGQEDPEEALAAAAELDDANRKLEDRIKGLDGQIADLESQKRLRRKARNFRDQESFFDEAQKGGRRVAGRNAGARQAGGTNSDGVGNDQGAAEVTDGDGDVALGAENEPPAGAPEGTDDEADFDNAADPGESPNRDSDAADPNDGFQDGAGGGGRVVGTVDVLPGTGAPIDPFAGDSVIVIGEVESGPGAAADAAGDSLEGRLNRARREREQLEKKSRQLERRSGELKRLADEF
jgi:hypothetical protein